MNKVKIVCTVGPACSTFGILKAMADEGMSVARFNFSHGKHEEHLSRLELVRDVERAISRPIATLLDTKGPEIRTGELEDGPVRLEQGKRIVLTTRPVIGNANEVSVSYSLFPQELKPGQDVFIDDGTMQLRVEDIVGDDVSCSIVVGGILGNRKGVNIPGADISLPALSEKDIDDIGWGIANELDYLAVSFVKNREDIVNVRRVLEERGGSMKIIAKIETRQAVDRLDDIIEVVDGMMIARGDLGVEIPTEEVPLVQKRIVDMCRAKGKAVIVATQMLDSMIRNPRPTRAEASDVANAVLDGADAVMLSGETANGAYPVKSVETMRRIVQRAEVEFDAWQRPLHSIAKVTGIPDAVSGASVSVARDMKATTIISMTSSGSTAKMVSRYRPPCSIVGMTPSRKTWRELALHWGVSPVMCGRIFGECDAVAEAIKTALAEGCISEGDIVVVTAGMPLGTPGSTNMLQVHTVGRILARGLSLLKREAYGRIVIARNGQEAMEKMSQGAILVANATDIDFVGAMRKASAVITETGGLTSHAAVVSLELGIPCIVSVERATSILRDGMFVTVDGTRGLVYHGNVRLGSEE